MYRKFKQLLQSVPESATVWSTVAEVVNSKYRELSWMRAHVSRAYDHCVGLEVQDSDVLECYTSNVRRHA